MRLVSCHIENFGKLSNLSLNFERGCNVILQENGWGKSTLAAFVKVMLYGFEEEKSRDELKNERKRYSPWQGGVYGGRLEFEAGGEHYVIARTFGLKEKEDRFSLRKKETNLECQDYSKNLGEELFSLDCNSFCRTVFVSQSDCETVSTDAINAKIGNLAEDTDDINNYESVNQRFLGLINQMSPTRKTGSLYRQREEISGMEDTVRAGRNIERTIEEIYSRLHEMLSKQKALKEEQDRLLKIQQEINAYKDIQVKQEKYQALCREFEERKGHTEKEESYFPGPVPKSGELEDVIAESAGLSAAKESVNIYRLTEGELRREKQLNQLFASGAPDQETLREQEKKYREFQDLRVDLAGHKLSGEEAERLDGYRKQFDQGVPNVHDVEKVIADWNSCVEKKNILGQKKLNYETLRNVARAGLNAEKPRSSAVAGIMFFAGLALILAGILLGSVGAQMIPGICIGALGLLALAAGVIAMRKNGSSRKKSGSDVDEVGFGSNDSLDRMGLEIAEDEAFIQRTEQETRGFLDSYGIIYERDEDILDCLYGLKAQIREYITLSERGHGANQKEMQKKFRELADGISLFLEKYYPKDGLEEEKFGAMLAELKELSGEYESLKTKREHFLNAENACEQLMFRLKKFVEGLSMTAQEDIQAQLLQIRSHLQSLSISMQEYNNIRERKETFEKAENMEEILRARPVQDTEDMQNINGRLEEIAGQLEKLYGYAADYNRRLDELREESDRLAEVSEHLEECKTEYGENLKKYELLKKTRELLERAKISFTARYTEPIRQSLGKYFELLSGERKERVFVDANTSVTVDEQGMQREPRFFSAGYRDMIGVCMRMALVDAMYQEEKPFIIFDDPFANLDGSKLEGALKLLEQVSKEYQVLYFTCHESRAL